VEILFIVHFCELVVSHTDITVDNVQPLHGPVSGGALLTITGQYIGVSTVRAVLIGTYRQNLDSNRYSSFNVHYILQLNITFL